MRDAPIKSDLGTNADQELDASVWRSRENERSPRFAELDAQIQAEDERRQNMPRSRLNPRRQDNPLPAAVCNEITHLARELQRTHGRLFIIDPKLKVHAARWFRSQLPPWGKPGARGYGQVTAAIELLGRFRRGFARLYPNERPPQIGKRVWKLICLRVIPGYEAMTEQEQRDAREKLQKRVRDRLSKRKRYAQRKTVRSNSP
jgi:hypothetical protein